MSEPRRLRLAYLSDLDFLAAFECVDTGFPRLREPGATNQLRRVRLTGVPADARPVDVFFDPSRAAFGVLIEHPSFDLVPFGDPPPRVDCEITLFQCDGEGKLVAVRDGETYERLDRPVMAKSLPDVIDRLRNPGSPPFPVTFDEPVATMGDHLAARRPRL